MWRSGLSPRYRAIDPVERTALASAMRGESFAQLCETLAQEGHDVQALGGLLGMWLQDAMIVSAGPPAA